MSIPTTDHQPDDQTDPQPAPPPAPDPFDPAGLRLSGSADQAFGTKKLLLNLPVRRPDKSWFIRTHADEAYTFDTMLLDLKEEREMYLVSKPLWGELVGEPILRAFRLIPAVNRQGVLFLWPLKLPGSDGKSDSWGETAIMAAHHGKTDWVRVASNMSASSYEVTLATGELPEPVFPTLPLNELLRIAFRKKIIDSIDHPVLRQLRGEV